MSYKFRNLVFEGGGVKGIAYGGALQVLEEMNLMHDIERVAGTSAGAINAALLAVGYTPAEVSEIIAGTNFNDFKDHSLFPFGDIRRLFKKYGWYKGDAFTEWVNALIEEKTGDYRLTFRHLSEQRPVKRYKHLYMVASNLSAQRTEVFSTETTPNMLICDALRMSMSIPLFYKAINYYEEQIVDGGISWNYPINIFDHKAYLNDPANGVRVEYSSNPDYVFNYETLGFRLDSKSVIEFEKKQWASEPVNIRGMKDYVSALISFMMEMANKSHLHDNDWNRTVFIDALDVCTTDFDLPNEKKWELLKSGKDCTAKYFEWRNSDPTWGKLPQ